MLLGLSTIVAINRSKLPDVRRKIIPSRVFWHGSISIKVSCDAGVCNADSRERAFTVEGIEDLLYRNIFDTVSEVGILVDAPMPRIPKARFGQTPARTIMFKQKRHVRSYAVSHVVRSDQSINRADRVTHLMKHNRFWWKLL